MGADAANTRGRRLRSGWRRCRHCLLVTGFLVVGGFVYLNQVGLPEFLKRPLVRALAEQGVVLEFSRLRFVWFRGLVAESVTLRPVAGTAVPQLTFAEVALDADWGRLWRGDTRIRTLELSGGRLIVPLVAPGEVTRYFGVDRVRAQLRFQAEEGCWELAMLQASCLGAQLRASGVLTNALDFGSWTRPATGSRPPDFWVHHLRRLREAARRVRFAHPPEIVVAFAGDARVPAEIRARLRLNAGATDTDWGRLGAMTVAAQVGPSAQAADQSETRVEIRLQALRSNWARFEQGRLEVRTQHALTEPIPLECEADLALADARTPWARSDAIKASGRLKRTDPASGELSGVLDLTTEGLRSILGQVATNRLEAGVTLDGRTGKLLRADWDYRSAESSAAGGSAGRLQFTGHLRPREPEAVAQLAVGPEWGGWALGAPYEVVWSGGLRDLAVTNLHIAQLDLSGGWKAPTLVVSNLYAQLGGGDARISGEIDIPTRRARGQAEAHFDLNAVMSLLTPRTQRWLGQYQWSDPPLGRTQVEVTLPAWTNAQPDWRGEVLPTLRLDGTLEANRAAFRDVAFESARTHFTFSNLFWHLPDFEAYRPEGWLRFEHRAHAITRDYSYRLSARMDPQALRPVIPPKDHRVLDAFTFTQPPIVRGEVTGRWRAPERTAFAATVWATNFTFRGETIELATGQLAFTNRFLAATDVEVRRSGEWATAEGVGYGFPIKELTLTNVVARVDPLRVAGMISTNTWRTLSPYLFQSPALGRVDGRIRVKAIDDVDLHFDVSGGPFRYWRFSASEIAGQIHWVDQALTLSNLTAAVYDGRLEGELRADLTTPQATGLSFRSRAENLDFHALMSDLTTPTNRVEGRLTGDLMITRAVAQDWGSWQGFGRAQLRDGFLWDIPLFGVFSPVLEAVVPGLGRSRVTDATALFTVTNSLVHSDDLELRSPFFVLDYRGTVDFDGRVDARVEAHVLRRTWIIGPILNLILTPITKLFEFQVDGTLAQPTKELVYIPKPLLIPLAPFRTLRELVGRDEAETGAPPPGEAAPPDVAPGDPP